MCLTRYSEKQLLVASIAALILVSVSPSQAQFFQVLPPIPLTPSSCSEARNITQYGINASDAKDFSLALEHFESASKLCPEDENVAVDLIQAAVDVRDFAKAESAAKALLAHHPHSQRVHVFLAYSYLMQRKFLDAGQTLQRLLAQDGNNPDALKLMGLTLFFYKDYALAEKELRAALAIRPHDENALYALGRVYQTQRRLPSAIRCFEQLLARDPNYYRAYDNLALCYQAEGEIAEANDMFKTAEQVASRVDPSYNWAYANHAVLLLKQGHTEEALQDIEKAVQINPRSAEDQYIWGKVLLAQDNLSGAENHLRMSIQFDAGLAKAHYLLGRLYKRMHESTRAQQEFARFKELSPAYAERRESLASNKDLKAEVLPSRVAIGQPGHR